MGFFVFIFIILLVEQLATIVCKTNCVIKRDIYIEIDFVISIIVLFFVQNEMQQYFRITQK